MLSVQEVQEFYRTAWARGDYLAVERELTSGPAKQLVGWMEIQPGERVLDVASGTGAVVLEGIKRSANFFAEDLVPQYVETTVRRAAEAGCAVEGISSCASDLPIESNFFQKVLSNFGVMFCPFHERAAQEIIRVLRPGGTFGLTTWTPEGLTGRLLRLTATYLPPAAEGELPPHLWGSEVWVDYLFSKTKVVNLSFEKHYATYPFSNAGDYLDFYAEKFGLMVTARAYMDSKGTWSQFRTEAVELLAQHRDSANGVFRPEFLFISGTKG